MNRYATFLMKHRKLIISIFLGLTIICAVLSNFVYVNYNFVDYLPSDAESTKALDIMYEEYGYSVANMRVVIKDLTIPEALEYKKEISEVIGVEEINWLDDAVDIKEPLEIADADTVNAWYKDGNALYSITVDEDKKEEVIEAIREIIGDDNYMSGSAVTNALAPVITSKEISLIMVVVVAIVLAVLFLTTTSWYEPILFLITIGIAIMLNRGTNLIFGSISFVTNAAGSVLQLAVSMDYSIFLLHRFADNRKEGMEAKEAMVAAVHQSVRSILSSGLTTVTGFLALVLMRFQIGPDMGWVMAKAVCLSLICVLCLLPALAVTTYKFIDKTQHRPFFPDFGKFSRFVYKCRIPEEFVPSNQISKLYSEHYSRFVISLETEEGLDNWYEIIDDVRDLAAAYYGDDFYYAGDLVSTEDLKTTITADNVKVNALAIGLVFLILLIAFKSISIPIILTVVIETSIWMNLAIPYFTGTTQYYIAYLIISSVQLGATIDYAILLTERYKENRETMKPKAAMLESVRACTVSVFTSAIILTCSGTVLGLFSSNGVLSQLGTLIGRGAAISFVLVIFVLPILLILFDKLIGVTTIGWPGRKHQNQK